MMIKTSFLVVGIVAILGLTACSSSGDAPLYIFTSSDNVSVSENSSLVVQVQAESFTNIGAPFFVLGDSADSALFNISSGLLTFASPPDFENPLDADGDNVYEVIVRAVDLSTGAASSQLIRATVTDETIIIEGADSAVVSENQVETNYAITASDDEGATVTLSLSGGDDQALFIFDDVTRELLFSQAPDFESPMDADGNNVYDIIFSATNGTETVTQAVALTVEDVGFAANITYPTPGANLGGVATSTTVSGQVTDIDPSDVTSLTVNGVAATFSIETPDRWSAMIPVNANDDTVVTVIAQNVGGATATETLNIKNRVPLLVLKDMIFDQSGNQLLFAAAQGVLAYGLDTQQVSEFASNDVGSGEGIRNAKSLEYDQAGNRLIVHSNFEQTKMTSVDLTSGARTLIANPGQTLTSDKIALDLTNDLIFYSTSDELFSMSLVDGTEANITGTFIGSGEDISFADGIDFAPSTNTVYVAQGGELVGVDVATGIRSLVAAGASRSFMDIKLDAADAFVINGGTPSTERGVSNVNVLTGEVTQVSNSQVGVGSSFSNPTRLDLDRDNDLLYVLEGGNQPRVHSVDLTSGNRALILDNATAAVGSGLSAAADELLLNPFNENELWMSQKFGVDRLDLPTGVRSTLGSVGFSKSGLAYEQAIDAFYVVINEPFDDDTVELYDANTGVRQVVSGPGVGAGPLFDRADRIKIDEVRRQLYISVAETEDGVSGPGIVQVDLASGDRTILSSEALSGLALDATNQILYTSSGDTIYAIDLLTGNQSVVTDDMTGTGPAITQFGPVEFNEAEQTLYALVDSSKLVEIDIASGDRVVLRDFTADAGLKTSALSSLVYDDNHHRLFMVASAQGFIVMDLNSNEVAFAAL